jgi:hypothetical protein
MFVELFGKRMSAQIDYGSNTILAPPTFGIERLD